MSSLGGLYKGSYPVLLLVLEKTMKNSEWLGRQERSGIERLSVLRAQLLDHWWDTYSLDIPATIFMFRNESK